jgi:hypothetical protein
LKLWEERKLEEGNKVGEKEGEREDTAEERTTSIDDKNSERK